MYYYLLLSVFLETICTTFGVNVGSVIFYNNQNKECWSPEEVSKLQARKIFQHLLPHPVIPEKVNSKYIKDTLRYYRGALKTIKSYSNSDHVTDILSEALLDTLGGHLRYEMLPIARFAYYAGYVPYKNVRDLHNFLESTKTLLNTKGIGWKEPVKVPQWSNLTVVKILIGSGKFFDPCASLVTKRDSNMCIHLPTPKLDDRKEPTAIAIPFKTGGLVSLSSPRSENILLKYYTTAARCILQRSPKNCRHSDFVNFNNGLWHWMKRDVAPYLMDEKLYVAYGGVLRIAAAVQSYGKGLSRRNLFDYQKESLSMWRPLHALTHSYLYINADWSPTFYVGTVLLAALFICILQIVYSYVCSTGGGCHCGSRSKTNPQIVTYSTVDTTFPSMLPTKNTSQNIPPKPPCPKSPKASVVSIKTQKVYDLNENAEKIMDVIMNENEESDSDSLDSDDTATQRPKSTKSPAELHTPIAQMRIINPRKVSMHSTTSTETQSGVTCCREHEESDPAWTRTCSSSSSGSGSWTSSKPSRHLSRNARTKSSRDVVTSYSRRSNTRSTTGT